MRHPQKVLRAQTHDTPKEGTPFEPQIYTTPSNKKEPPPPASTNSALSAKTPPSLPGALPPHLVGNVVHSQVVQGCRVVAVQQGMQEGAAVPAGHVVSGYTSLSPSPLQSPPSKTYFRQVGQGHSEFMGLKSLAYCCFFNCRFPVGTRAEPKRWGRGRSRS